MIQQQCVKTCLLRYHNGMKFFLKKHSYLLFNVPKTFFVNTFRIWNYEIKESFLCEVIIFWNHPYTHFYSLTHVRSCSCTSKTYLQKSKYGLSPFVSSLVCHNLESLLIIINSKFLAVAGPEPAKEYPS